MKKQLSLRVVLPVCLFMLFAGQVKPQTTPNVVPSTGNAGFGTNSPSEKLEVVGNAKINGEAKVEGHLKVRDSVDIQMSLNVQGETKIEGDLLVQGKSTLSGNVTFNSDFLYKKLAKATLQPTDYRLVTTDKFGNIGVNDGIIVFPPRTTICPDTGTLNVNYTFLPRYGDNVFLTGPLTDCSNIRLGIGTEAPHYMLDVRGTAQVFSILAGSANIGALAKIKSLQVGTGNTLKLENITTGTFDVENLIYSTDGPLSIQSTGYHGTYINALGNTGMLQVGGGYYSSTGGIGCKLNVIGAAGSNVAPLSVSTEGGAMMIFANTNGGAGYNWISQAGDEGIYWSDGGSTYGHNLNAGFVIAPMKDALSGIRIDKDGNVTIKGSLTVNASSTGLSNYWVSSSPNVYYTGGTVGIGTTTPNTAYLLDVCGDVHARKVIVSTTGCDFVFESNYKLMSITEREGYLKQNKHLPNVVAAKDMEEKGTDMGTTMMGILQNTEELNLYVIQLNKKITELEEKLKAIEK